MPGLLSPQQQAALRGILGETPGYPPGLLDERRQKLSREMSHQFSGPGVPVNMFKDPAARQQALDMMATGLTTAPLVGDVAGLAADAHRFATDPASRTWGNAALTGLGMLPFIPGMTAWHGSPHILKGNRFDSKYIGTGEGNQAYGHGHYVAERRGVGKSYMLSNPDEAWQIDGRSINDLRKELPSNVMELAHGRGINIEEAAKIWDSGLGAERNAMDNLLSYGDVATARQFASAEGAKVLDSLSESGRLTGGGYLYEVDLPDEHIAKMLDWDAPLGEQPAGVRQVLSGINQESGGRAYQELSQNLSNYPEVVEEMLELAAQGRLNMKGNGQELVSDWLKAKGIPGIKYFDGGSRAAGEGTRNFVVFDDSLLKVLTRNGEPIK